MHTHRLEAMVKGWFVGRFEPTVFATEACEVAVKRYRAGDRDERHVHRVATEVTLIVSGVVLMNGQQHGAGTIVRIDPGEATDFVVLEDALTVVVKVPCVGGDKYVVPPRADEPC